MTDTKICANPQCAKVFARPAGYAQDSWDRRRFCCPACRLVMKHLVRHCTVCSALLKRDDNRESARQYRRRVTCFGCFPTATKTCPICAADFTVTGRYAVETQRTCGKPECAAANRRGTRKTVRRGKSWNSARQVERDREAAAARIAAEGDFIRPAIKTDSVEAWLAAAGGVNKVRDRSLQYSAANDASGPVPARPTKARGLA